MRASHQVRFSQQQWDAAATITSFDVDLALSNPNTREHLKREFWRNLVSEYDARHLTKHLVGSRIPLSDEFWKFHALWSEDERNHYQGFLYFYSRLYYLEEKMVEQMVAGRQPDFSPIEHLLRDEFSVAVCIAYDELASARGYQDSVDLFNIRVNPELGLWHKKMAKDEMNHCVNALRILQINHKDRVPEAGVFLKNILHTVAEKPSGYTGTFLFDHDSDPIGNCFEAKFLQDTANTICEYLDIPTIYPESVP